MSQFTTLEVVESKHPCGFCSTSPGNDRHDLCPSGILGRNDKVVWRCPCGCERSRQIRCFTCNRREAEGRAEPTISNDAWRCLDVDACAAELEARLALNPTIALIRTIAQDDKVRFEKPTLPRTTPAARKEGKCLHCGESTKGGLFRPGHDAAWLSQMVNEIHQLVPGSDSRFAATADRVSFMEEKGCSEALIAKFRKRVNP